MVNKMLYDVVYTEVNRIRKSKETSSILDVSYKHLSDAAVGRVVFWLKRIATLVCVEHPNVQSVPTQVPPRMKSALKRYACDSNDDINDVYYLFKEMLKFLFRNYSPKNKLSTTLTVDTVDQSVIDPNGPLYPYLERLLLLRSKPEK